MTLNNSPFCTPAHAVPKTVADPLLPLNRTKRGVALPNKTWPQHSVLTISLLNMTTKQKGLVKHNINKWAPYTNLYFKFTDRANGDIRIAADNNASSGWSKIGTDAKEVPLHKATMSIGFNCSPTELAAMIQHEFGHGLGLKHEHQHPERTLDLNKQSIYLEYELQGEFPWQADHNLIQKLPANKVTVSPYDKDSIMHYGFAASRLNSGDPVPHTEQLSAGDKHFMQTLYPTDNSFFAKLLNTATRAMINTSVT
ncbi:Astacin (Peptidase family M12A) [Pseudomonas antarctica]|uniref:Astacin (Peptidase family M12A) n=1 Tax=Pseudomonas antarctica TaxID=219572 RepID=A0A1H0DFW4_9PSED|nr:M12 family metallopeptidase [Pseudomonas antarctica]KAF2407710.1 astacin (peptidase family M12A) [Pseudomonas antarctica]SDN69008.1 Astacin (Peptidase family M12A) [Pseudomonas antarctica]